MDPAVMIAALDAGFDVEQLAMVERLVRELHAHGVTDEDEVIAACTAALGVQQELPRVWNEMN